MASRSRLFEQFGPFILFKRLETDSLGELWRAGRIEGERVVQTVALRKLTGGNRAALAATAEAAAHALPLMTGTYIVAGQTAGVVGGEPFVAWNYTPGRTLRHIVDRARDASSPAPLPLDQAIVIAEKIAQSFVAVAEFRDTSGQRLTHGAAIPQFVWITDEGEIRMAGQLFGSPLAVSIRDGSIPAIARYFSPELRSSGVPSPLSEVYALGALLFLLVSGEEPPDALSSSAFANAVLGARTMTGDPMPDDIKLILRRTLTLDPGSRLGSVADAKQAISALAQSGKYAATTFNLAFYLSTALSKEMDAEAAERDKEAAVDVGEVLAAAAATAGEKLRASAQPAAPVAAAASPLSAPFASGPLSTPPQTKSKAPLAIAAVVLLAAVGGGAFLMLKKEAPAAATPVKAATIPSRPPIQIPQPVVATPAETAPDGTTETAATATVDAEAQKRAFEDAVNQRLQAEVMKLQQQFTQDLKQQQAKDAPVTTEAPAQAAPAQAAPPREETTTVSAAALDAAQRENRPAPVTSTQPPQAAVPTQTAQAEVAAVSTQAPPPPAAPQIREGDVVDVSSLDEAPRALKPIRPVYPLVAARQKIQATIILTVLVSEKGDVLDVRVLRGNKSLGFDDAAIRAIRQTSYSPATKNGKRVKTWLPQTIIFKP